MKKILLAIFLLVSGVAFSQPGVVIADHLNTIGVASYPTHLDSLQRGGFRVVSTIVERNAITSLRRKVGMWVYVTDSLKIYSLAGGITNSDWSELSLGSASSADSVSQSWISDWRRNNNAQAQSLGLVYHDDNKQIIRTPRPYATIHGLIYAKGKIWGSDMWSPPHVYRFNNPDDLADIDTITLDASAYDPDSSDYQDARDIVYVNGKDKVYTVANNEGNGLGESYVIEIDPVTMAQTIIDTIQTDYNEIQSLCTDGINTLYLVDGGNPGRVHKINLTTYVRTSAYISGSNFMHAIRYDGTYLYVTARSGTKKVYKIDPATLTVVVSATLTNSTTTDDFAIAGDYLWIANESNTTLAKVKKADLSETIITTGITATGSFGTFFYGSYIWACFNSHPQGTILRLNPETNEQYKFLLDTLFDQPNEIVTDGSRLFINNYYDTLSPGGSANLHGALIRYAIPTMTYVSGGSAVTASNGLTKTVNDIALGGTFLQNTTIFGLGSYYFRLKNGGDTYFSIDKPSNQYAIGDISGSNNGTALTIEDGSNLSYIKNGALTMKFGINNQTPTVALDVVGEGLFTGDVTVPADAYNATTWNGNNEVPTKDAIRDKIETLGSYYNSNVGSGYRWVIPNTNNIKTFTATNGLTPDSATTNQIGIKLGGTLTVNTTIAQAGFNLDVTNSATNSYVRIRPTNFNSYQESNGGFLFSEIWWAALNPYFQNVDSNYNQIIQFGSGVLHLGNQHATASGAPTSSIEIWGDSLGIKPFLGKLWIDSVRTGTNENTLLAWKQGGTDQGKVAYITIGSGLDLTAGVLTATGGGGFTNLTQFVSQTAWRAFYSDGSGDVQEQAFGTSGKVWTSTGTTSVPTWQDIPAASLTKGVTTISSSATYRVLYDSAGILSNNAAFKYDPPTGELSTTSINVNGIGTISAACCGTLVISSTANTLLSVAGVYYPQQISATGTFFSNTPYIGGQTASATIEVDGGAIFNTFSTSAGDVTINTATKTILFSDASEDEIRIGTSSDAGDFLLQVSGSSSTKYEFLYQSNQVSRAIGQFQNLHASGFVSFDFLDNSSVRAGGMGYANPSASSLPNKFFVFTNSKDLIFSIDNTSTASLTINGSTGVATFLSDVIVPDEVYDATAWNGSLEVPTKNAVRDKIESLSGGVSDGDKGDITVSSSGAVWTIDNDVVTYAKMQNISATNRVMGRITGGSGDMEELTGTQATSLLDVFSTSAKGLVPVASGGSTTTQFLRKDGTWVVPTGTVYTGGIGIDITSEVVSIKGWDAWDNFTTNTTTTSVTTLGTISTPSGTRGVLVVTLIGIETGNNSKGLTGKKFVHWKNDSGTVTVLQIVDEQPDYRETWTTATWTVDASGGDLRIRVTADSVSSTDWNAQYQLKYNAYSL